MSAIQRIDEAMVQGAAAISRRTRIGGWRLADECITAAMALLALSQAMRSYHAHDTTGRVIALISLIVYVALMHGARRRLGSDRRTGGGRQAQLRERPMRLVGLAITTLLIVFCEDLETAVFALGFACAVAQSAFKASVVDQRPA